ncbi:hypothetical protein ACHAXT_000795 [Thalassiosira profunda]
MEATPSSQGSEAARPYLHVTWTSPTTSDGQLENNETSMYDVEWLQRFQHNNSSRRNHQNRTEVQPQNAIRRDGPPLACTTPEAAVELASLYPRGDAPLRGSDGLVHVDYHSIIGGEGQILREGLFALLHSVFRDGAAIISGTPLSAKTTAEISHICRTVEALGDDELPVAKVAKAMSGGELSHGALYGNVFHVRVGERDSNNVAYTSEALCPHQDLAYYESPPGMQLLHCAAMGNAVEGGESTLIDAMAAAHRLREVRPQSFECLVRCPATFVKQRDGACLTYRRPHIVLAEDGGSTGLDREIAAVFWSPPFEGPVCLPPDMVDRYYEAYADFERMLNGSADGDSPDDELSQYAHDFTWERKLDPGDMLVFNNRRMVHGRRGFSGAQGASFEESQRHLVGCYTNIDDTLNSYRVLLRERDYAMPILNVGNGTNIVP